MSTRKRSLLEYSVPEPAGQGQPQSAPPLGLLGTAENVSMGLGRGVTNQLAGLLGMVQNPGAVVNSLYGLARTPPNQLAQMAVTGVKDTARNALASPMGFGEFIGNNVSPGRFLHGAPSARIPMAVAPKPNRIIYRGTTGSADRIKDGVAPGALFAAADEGTARLYAGARGNVERIEVLPDAKVLVEGSAEYARITGRKRGKLIDTMRKGENLKSAANDVADKAKSAGYDAVEFNSMKDLGIAIFNESKFIRQP